VKFDEFSNVYKKNFRENFQLLYYVYILNESRIYLVLIMKVVMRNCVWCGKGDLTVYQKIENEEREREREEEKSSPT
jgi:hypothetical protein